MSAWRDAQEAAGNLKRKRMWKQVRVLGLDGAYVLGWGEKRAVIVAVDLGEGKPVAIGYEDEHNPDAIRRWLEPIVKRLGVSVIVTDDLMQYKTVAEKLDLEYQICQFHVRVGWDGPCMSSRSCSLQSGCGYWMKSAICSKNCRPQAGSACSSCGSKSPSAELEETSCAHPWSSCVIH